MTGEGHIRVNINTAQFASGKGGSIPRVCGAAASQLVLSSGMVGLSPRVRGSQTHELSDIRWMGLSPRVRGSHIDLRQVVRQVGSIPTVCGAAKLARGFGSSASGLSPRVRGSPLPTTGISITVRSIPTCAGQPPSHYRHKHHRKVYPHVCGAASL